MRRVSILLVMLVILTTIGSSVNAQADKTMFGPGTQVSFEHFTTDEGLSQNAGLVFLQDKQGYLWIGTGDGLNRYDGYNFTIFRNDPADPNSIGFNSIITLFQTSDGAIWVGTWGGGLYRYDPATSIFVRFPLASEEQSGVSNSVVTDIYESPDGLLWVATQNGLDSLDPKTGQGKHYVHDAANPDSLSSDVISVIAPAEGGNFWVGTGSYSNEGAGLNLFNPATGKAKKISPIGDCLSGANISDIVSDTDGSLWISFGGYSVNGGGLDHYYPTENRCIHFENSLDFGNQLTDNNFTDLAFDKNGTLWASSWSGGLWFMGQNGKFINIRHDPSNPQSLKNDNILAIYPDRSGILWAGIQSGGIDKLNLDSMQFSTYRSEGSNPNSLPSDHVSSFTQTPDGTLWVGTWEEGFTRFDPASGIFTRYQNDPGNPNSLAADLVSSLYAEPDGTIWIGTLGGGLDHFNPADSSFKNYRNIAGDPSSLPNDQITAMIKDRSGRMWVGSFGGVSRFDKKAETFVTYPLPAPPMSMALVGNQLWLGTWGAGIYRLDLAIPANLDPATATFEPMANDPADANSLSNNGVWSILPASDQTIWIGTEGGLNNYDPSTGNFKNYTTKDGLRNSTIMGILEDKAGNIWVTTNNGLAKFSKDDQTFTIFDKSDGLQGNEYNSGAYFIDSDRRIFIGGVNGFSSFDPMTLQLDAIPPQVVITDFKIFNESQPVPADGANPINLKYDQNFISFDFASLDFHNPKKNRYEYRLVGFDKDWVQADTRNYASYTNLPGGNYTFQVKASNSAGVWSEQNAEINLNVIPPFWQTWPFRIGLILGVISLVFAGFQLRIRSVKEQNARLQKIVQEQQRVENELRQSEARFKSLFETSSVGMGLMSKDRVLMDVNPALCKMLGYSREELIGISPASFTVEEDFPSATSDFDQIVTNDISKYIAERRYIRKDGSIFWAQISMSTVTDAQGLPIYLVGLAIDIDEKKRAQAKLAEQEAEYHRELERKINERTEELNQANKLLQQKAAQDAVIAERSRLARDLHDAVTQTLFSTTLIADVLPEIWEMNPDEGRKRLEEVRQLTRGALAEMRTLLVELRPNALIEVPLPTLLRQLSEAFIGRTRIPVELSCEGEAKISPDVQMCIYRLAQESLNNVAKHAKATQVAVTLRLGETVRLTVVDNGVGFDPATITADHLGLKIMRERAEAIGAKYSVYSEPGEGTQVSLVWESASITKKDQTTSK